MEHLVQAARSMAYPELALGPVLLVLAVLGPPAWWLAGVTRGSRWLALVAAGCLAVAVALTLARPGLRSSEADWSRVRAACLVTDARGLTPEALLNLLLLVPFAALAVLALGHPILVWSVAVLASAGIEVVQAAYAVGTCDSSDLIRNAAGALVAAALAASLRKGGQAVEAAVVMNQRTRARNRAGARPGAGLHGDLLHVADQQQVIAHRDPDPGAHQHPGQHVVEQRLRVRPPAPADRGELVRAGPGEAGRHRPLVRAQQVDDAATVPLPGAARRRAGGDGEGHGRRIQ
jgi:hypothetical protein